MAAARKTTSARRSNVNVDPTNAAGLKAGKAVRQVATSAFVHGKTAAKVSSSFLSGFWAGLTTK